MDEASTAFEVPLQALLGLSTPEGEQGAAPVMSDTDRAKAEAVAKAEIATVLHTLDKTLSAQTFIINERATVVDICLACAVSAAAKLGLVDGTVLTGVCRWFLTISAMPAVTSTLGSAALAAVSVKLPPIVTEAKGNKWNRCRVRVKELLEEGVKAVGTSVTVKGWLRTAREADKGELLFVELNDGSSPRGLQLVLSRATCEGMDAVAKCGGAGASISATGTVVRSPPSAKKQVIELHCTSAKVLGAVYMEDGSIGGKEYPMAKKKHTLEFLREKAHLRPRSKVFSCAMRVRHAMAFATHKFFNDRGLLYVHTPLITASDCEGAGEQFSVTTLLPDGGKASDIPTTKDGKIDYSQDFFGRQASLTVSGQLNVETHACALSDVYTFGPTFRAENSHTKRHLAEFWMIEPEISFAELSDDMALAEDYVKYCAQYAMDNCADDLYYFEHEFPAGEKGLRARLQNVVDNDFARITYTDAVALLQRDAKAKKVKFEEFPHWGDDLGSEHERYLSEKIYERPTIVINYPKGIKAFYMRLNDDNETVAAMDVLVPRIGELIGGSKREERPDVLVRRSLEAGVDPKDMWWYNDLRKYGTVPHAGFGLGFERLIMFVTGLENIRDVIPFPRTPGKVDF